MHFSVCFDFILHYLFPSPSFLFTLHWKGQVCLLPRTFAMMWPLCETHALSCQCRWLLTWSCCPTWISLWVQHALLSQSFSLYSVIHAASKQAMQPQCLPTPLSPSHSDLWERVSCSPCCPWTPCVSEDDPLAFTYRGLDYKRALTTTLSYHFFMWRLFLCHLSPTGVWAGWGRGVYLFSHCCMFSSWALPGTKWTSLKWVEWANHSLTTSG